MVFCTSIGAGYDGVFRPGTTYDNAGKLVPTMKPVDQEKTETRAGEKPAEAVLAGEEKLDFSNVVIEPLFEDRVHFETFSKSDFRAVKVLECEAVPKSKKLLKFTLNRPDPPI